MRLDPDPQRVAAWRQQISDRVALVPEPVRDTFARGYSLGCLIAAVDEIAGAHRGCRRPACATCDAIVNAVSLAVVVDPENEGSDSAGTTPGRPPLRLVTDD